MHNDEILTDNTAINYCDQCQKCIHWGKSGTPWDNRYDKAYCEVYAYPNRKPSDVINNLAPCSEREVE